MRGTKKRTFDKIYNELEVCWSKPGIQFGSA